MNIASLGSRLARIVRTGTKILLVFVLLVFHWALAADGVNDLTVQQIQALLAEKSSRTPAQQKMDSQLLQAVRESRGQPMAAGVNLAPANVGTDVSGKLAVDISVRSMEMLDALTVTIEALGGEILYPSWQYNSIRARIDIAQAETIAGLPDVVFIQAAVRSLHGQAARTPAAALPASPARPADTFAARVERVKTRLTEALRQPLVGTVNSQGDRTHRADDTRNTYGYSGAGVRIGVLSDTFNSLGAVPADIASGNLPGPGNPLGHLTPVTVVQDLTGGTDEGRAMVQIVHDLAPEAQLFFATADVSEAGFASNIVALRNTYNCDIIIDDVFYFDEPVFQDGIVAQAVNTVTAAGALYFSSAGNEGNVAKGTAGVFEGDFNDAGSPAFTFPGGTKAGTIHNFGTVGSPVNGDIVTSTGEAYTLNWADPVGASGNDYDLFVVSSTGTVKAASTNIQNGTQLAFEIISPPALVAGDRLVVFKTAAAAVRAFSVNTLRGTLTVKTTGQTHGHSSAVDAFSVAAAPAAAAFNGVAPVGPFPGAFSAANQVETFTSDGPRRVFFNANGSAITPGNFLFGTNGGTVRAKPDVTAADGVSTTLPGASGLNPFYGTSAAAPHAGAIAGLLKSANPALTPAQIRTILTTTAVDVEGAGYDNISGFGIVQAFQAMQAVSPTPQAAVNLGTVTATEGAFSNSNGVIDPGELANIIVQLTNPSLVSATSVQASLTTSTPGVTVTQGSASYGTIAASGSATNSVTPFTIGVSSGVPCGTVIALSLSVSFGGGSSPQIFLFNVPTGFIPGASISSSLGAVPPTGTGFTSTSGQQTGRLSRSGVASTCAAPKANPGLTTAVGSRQFDAYTFTNTSASAQCVTVTLSAANGINLYSASYTSAGFVPANPSTNYLADAGSSSASATYSFTAPAGQAFTTVVHDVNVLPTSGSAYTLSVSLAACTNGPACTPVTITTASIASGSTGAAYAQSFAATGGSGSYTFSLSGGLPAGLSFSGNTLSGTPTQAGSFPITITATDVAGCTPGTKLFTLVIAGNAPGSVAATAGDGQSTLPLTTFGTALQATVLDGASAPLPGVNVTFTAPSSGASGTFPGGVTSATVVSGAGGIATAPTFTANATTGSYSVTANVNGIAPASFNLSNTCPASFVVTSSADSGAGTLRSIVANACTGITVTFNPGISLITLTTEIPIAKAITINGPGANLLAISGNSASRVFNIAAGAAAVSISGMTIRDGKPVGGTTGGGGILINNGASAGAVNLSNCVISGNDASVAGNPLGGGIDNEGGTVTIDRCSIVNNVSTFRGGGLQNQGFGSMTITNSTIAGNTAGTTGIGGGIRSLLNLTLTNDTFFGNSALTAGNISRSGGTITFGNTIIAGGFLVGSGGTGPDISGAGFASVDYNLIENTATGTITGTTTHNITGVSPNLLPLANYGGPSPTLLPQPSSPVLNAGDPATAAATDQRGFARVVGAAPDMGAVEASYVLTATGGTPQSAPLNTAFALPLQATLTESALPVNGVNVTFTAPGSGASGTFPAIVTIAVVPTSGGGVASSPVFTANGTVGGPYTVTGGVGGPVSGVSYSLTNVLCPPPPPLVVSAPSIVGAGSPNRVASIALIGGATYAWTITNGTITSGQGTNQITFTAGVAGTTLSLGVGLTVGACPFGGGFANVTVAPVGQAVQFYGVTSCRLVDTRNANGPLGGPALDPLGIPDRAFTLTGNCGIPSGATAVSANVTVVSPPFGGALTFYAGDGNLPQTLTISFNPGKTRASNSLLQLALDGTGTVKVGNSSTGTVDLVLDVNGYFQ